MLSKRVKAKAKKDLKDQEKSILDEQDRLTLVLSSEDILSMMESPPRLTAKILKAIKEYNAQVEGR